MSIPGTLNVRARPRDVAIDTTYRVEARKNGYNVIVELSSAQATAIGRADLAAAAKPELVFILEGATFADRNGNESNGYTLRPDEPGAGICQKQ